MNGKKRGSHPAYPRQSNSVTFGMTIREAFTMAALSGINANPAIHSSVTTIVERRGEIRPVAFLLAQMAVEVADQALKALEDKKQVGFEERLELDA